MCILEERSRIIGETNLSNIVKMTLMEKRFRRFFEKNPFANFIIN